MSQLKAPFPPSRQRGVSILAALFFMLLFAAIAAAMVSLTTTSNVTSALDVQGSRAYQAARAGVEWGLFHVLNDPANGPPTTATAALPVCVAGTPAVPGFAVAVGCDQFPPSGTVPDFFEEGSKRFRLYRITATASAPGPGGIVEREISVTVEKCRDTAGVGPFFDC